jgi:hypothetical protein
MIRPASCRVAQSCFLEASPKHFLTLSLLYTKLTAGEAQTTEFAQVLAYCPYTVRRRGMAIMAVAAAGGTACCAAESAVLWLKAALTINVK